VNIDLPYPNITCRCGSILLCWRAVEEHWERHRQQKAEQEWAEEMMGDMLKGQPSR
jgi:hypothetical protein